MYIRWGSRDNGAFKSSWFTHYLCVCLASAQKMSNIKKSAMASCAWPRLRCIIFNSALIYAFII